MNFFLSSTPIDPRALQLTLQNDKAGAYASFEGWVRVRNEGKEVVALEYEAYGALAVTEGNAVLAEARAKFELIDIACCHRVGRLGLGELAVWVGVTAEHRAPAFEACRYAIDELKARVPIWKKEHYKADASTWINSATRGAYADPSVAKKV